jgi:centromere/kinetochore protein ZW10
VGKPSVVEHVETHLVSRDEGNSIATTGNIVNQDWDAAWDSDDNQDADTANAGAESTTVENLQQVPEDEDDGADAWGWGDDGVDDTENAEPALTQPPVADLMPTQEKREVTISEKYWISSMPLPIFERITSIYDDGAKLAKMEDSPIAKAVTALFGLPTFVLAMYRAVSPHYYAQHACGNMLVISLVRLASH